MTDHTQHLKDTYWEIKYREWRGVILSLPAVTFVVGFLLAVGLFPRTVEVPVDRIVERTREVPVEKIVTKQLPAPPPANLVTKVDTRLLDVVCVPKDVLHVLNAKSTEIILAPKNCGINMKLLRGAVRLVWGEDTSFDVTSVGNLGPPISVSHFQSITDTADFDIHINSPRSKN
ncbi:hypothetical protein KMZ93_04315 [Bradyrhizobium sediminis]|uniref:Uncharacterized protein n=1 Tax=Bradyrhizobium sediminis TaxID=2840469 RepID=A0A975P043_9BRAD|nr:hypothetical protein [Bradyrhizobium sediminis]QWG24160.1 hypothetical protein KMZ93_04315 [Bradyrhizobium sediminis]